jgi:hypothetical protein
MFCQDFWNIFQKKAMFLNLYRIRHFKWNPEKVGLSILLHQTD